MRILTLIVLGLLPAVSVYAANDSAAHCVKLGPNSLTNTCAEKIEVFWCAQDHKSPQVRCKTGPGSTFYTQRRSLRAGQTISNERIIPHAGSILFGACYAQHETKLNEGGHYDCL